MIGRAGGRVASIGFDAGGSSETFGAGGRMLSGAFTDAGGSGAAAAGAGAATTGAGAGAGSAAATGLLNDRHSFSTMRRVPRANVRYDQLHWISTNRRFL